MKITTKAILASALIFPGVGQLILKRYVFAAGFMITSLWAAGVIFYYIIKIAKAVYERILSGDIEPDILLIRKLMIEQQANLNITLVNIATWVLIIVWLISIIDACLVGKAKKSN